MERSRASAESNAPASNRHAQLGLTDETLRRMYFDMVLARELADRVWILNRQGKVIVVHSPQGHEAAQIGAAYTLRPGHDWIVPYYRDSAICLALGMPVEGILAAYYGKVGDSSSHGRQMPGHWSYPQLKIVTQSSLVATQIVHAVGIALASQLRGEDAVTWCGFGDGATSKGDFHEALNFAGVRRLPVVFFCENNRYAISTPLAKQMPVERVSDRAAAYGMPGVTVDGTDPVAVYEAVRAAVERARAGQGPTLVEARCIRLTAHSSDDDHTRYRTAEDLAAMKVDDPIVKFRQYLTDAQVLTAEADQAIRQRALDEVDRAVAFAESSPYPDLTDLDQDVYAEESVHQ